MADKLNMSKRLQSNNNLSRIVEGNERLGEFENSPFNLLGKGINRAAAFLSGSGIKGLTKERGRVIRSTIKATNIIKGRGKVRGRGK